MNKYENELDIFLFDILEISKKTNLKVWLEAGTLLDAKEIIIIFHGKQILIWVVGIKIYSEKIQKI